MKLKFVTLDILSNSQPVRLLNQKRYTLQKVICSMEEGRVQRVIKQSLDKNQVESSIISLVPR